MKRLFALLTIALLMGFIGTPARGQDDQYVRIYNLIQEADMFSGNGRPQQALPKYLEAQSALERFQRANPTWNTKVVTFRLSYLASRISILTAQVPATTTTTPSPGTAAKPATTAVAPPPAADVQSQLGTLQSQVRQLQTDKTLLEAKLKEALSSQPANLDPRELAKAEDRVKSLQKENDLLKVAAAQQKTKPATPAEAASLEQARRDLSETSRKLNEQTERANTLALEKTALQNKLNNLATAPWNQGTVESTRKALEEANRQLAAQRQTSSRLALEKDALQARLRSMGPDSEAVAALRAENTLLKKQLADTSPAGGARADDASRKLAQAQAQIAALQSDKEMLRLEKMALESRLKQMSSGTVASSVMPAASRPADLTRIKDLESERDDLQKKLNTALKDLYGRKGKEVAGRVDELETQLGTLRARLEVFEARQVPYTSEELAMFKAPQPKLTSDPKAGKKSVKELPAGSVALVAEAQRYFSARQLDKAEANYQQVLKQDDKNVLTLANLAAIQIEENHLPEAEKNIQKAVALAPDDSYSQTILGQLRFRQGKYDEALDALSRASKLDPQNAQIQNLLGLTLGQKGMRGPAETALRKAITLDPGNADAHNNLAVIYLTQQPPLFELARWHYQKALAGGHARNPELESVLAARKPIE